MLTEHSIGGGEGGWEGSKKTLILQEICFVFGPSRWIRHWDPLLDTEEMVPYMEIIDQPSI